MRCVSRYELHGELASGGMAVVHYGRHVGALGFSHPVAVKSLLPQLARDDRARAMFLDEARLASRIRHPNVVPILDVVPDGNELLLVMEYVHGESLAQLLRAARAAGLRVPLKIALAVATGVLHGLHAAHEAADGAGAPLGIVHRDVSPHNVLVGVDGVPRVLDFGIARAEERLEHTSEGVVKGKLAYMAPEQLAGAPVDRRADVFAASVVLWEMMAGRRLFVSEDGALVQVDRLLASSVDPPGRYAPGTPRIVDAIVLHGLARSPERRFATAREMALALERASEVARASEVGEWVASLAAEALAERAERVAALERTGDPVASDDRPTVPSPLPSSLRSPVASPAPSSLRSPQRTRRESTTMTAPIATPQAMALTVRPIAAAPPPRRGATVARYLAVAAGVALSAIALRAPFRAPAAHAPSPCPADMVHVGRLCVDAAQSIAKDPAGATNACAAKGRRLPTAAETEAMSTGPKSTPPPSPHTRGTAFRCVIVP